MEIIEDIDIDFNEFTEDLKKEFSVNADGQVMATIAGVARLLGLPNREGLSKNLRYVNLKPSKLARLLMDTGFGASTVAEFSDGVPDVAMPVIARYYAYDAKKKTNQAKRISLTFEAIGYRAFFTRFLGQQPPVIENKVSKLEERYLPPPPLPRLSIASGMREVRKCYLV